MAAGYYWRKLTSAQTSVYTQSSPAVLPPPQKLKSSRGERELHLEFGEARHQPPDQAVGHLVQPAFRKLLDFVGGLGLGAPQGEGRSGEKFSKLAGGAGLLRRVDADGGARGYPSRTKSNVRKGYP